MCRDSSQCIGRKALQERNRNRLHLMRRDNHDDGGEFDVIQESFFHGWGEFYRDDCFWDASFLPCAASSIGIISPSSEIVTGCSSGSFARFLGFSPYLYSCMISLPISRMMTFSRKFR